MSFCYSFTTLEDMSQLKQLIDFMATQSVNYPHYHDTWLPKAEHQLSSGEKGAYLAFKEGRFAADLVFQTCRNSGLGILIEIKNARVHPELRDRHIMKFMLRQLYRESQEKFDGVIADARANQTNTIDFLVSEGFIPVAKTTLYEDSMEEITMFRPLKANAEFLIPRVKKVIIAKSINA